MSSNRTVAGIAGLTFAALALATFATPPAPSAGAAEDEIVAYFTHHGQAVLFVSVLTLLALAPLLVFAAAVSAGARGRPWSLLSVAGATGISAATLVATGANVALVVGAGSWLALDPLLGKAFFDLQAAIFPGIGVFAAAFLLGAVGTARADGWMPRPLVGVGAGAAALELISVPAGLVPGTVFAVLALPGYLLVLLWMISTSIVLLRRPDLAAVPVPAA